MELIKVQIENFRSIKNETINFDNNCLILLGKNEAGKSNVLKAIAAAFGEYKVSDKDKRKRIDNEKIEKYYVRAVIKLSDADIKTIEARFRSKFQGVENIVFKKEHSLTQYIAKHFYNLLLKIDIGNDQTFYFAYWKYTGKDLELSNQIFILENSIVLESGMEFNLETELFNLVKELYLEHPIRCNYWQYSNDYLLPNSILIGEFISNPQKHKAIENIFQLCNREDIANEFENALSEDGDYTNLLEQVSKKVTSTFQKIWKDLKGTSIQLLPNGDEVLVKIVDRAKYNCEDRSDGFKKFISILLMLSTQSRANKISENHIILIDEPDQSLYPTSAQYLRDELIEISNKSKVIYSTHSQYMIDSEYLDRHIVVEKKDDVTTLKKENAYAPYTTDELLRRAIGSSIFECIKSKNIVFEGFLDKKLFNLYCRFHKLEKEYKEYGQIYLAGISGVDSIVSILNSANKNFIIVADSDETSKNKRIEFNKNHPELKDFWLAYADSVESISTMEDFISIDVVEREIKKYNVNYTYDTAKNAIQNIEKGVNKDKDKKQEVKNALLSNIKKENLLDTYSNYLASLKEKLKNL